MYATITKIFAKLRLFFCFIGILLSSTILYNFISTRRNRDDNKGTGTDDSAARRRNKEALQRARRVEEIIEEIKRNQQMGDSD